MPTLMVSISGIRGIIGDGLDPEVIIKYTSAFADFCGKGKIIVGRDARISGEMVKNIVSGTLAAKGIDVIDIGIVPTPTVQYTVKTMGASGGIAITASHNPNEWNALKLLNSTGQFMTLEENVELQKIIQQKNNFESWQNLGKITFNSTALNKHLEDASNKR